MGGRYVRTSTGDSFLAFGLIGVVVALAVIVVLGGVQDLQGADSAGELARAATSRGNEARGAVLVDVFAFVPAYLAAGYGAFYGFRPDTTGGRRAVGPVGRFGIVVVAFAAFADQIENVLVLLALGTIDLDDARPDRISVTDGYVDAVAVFGTAKLLLGAVALLTAAYGLTRRRPATSEPATTRA